MSLQTAEVRDFSGGWNVADSDMNLVSRYQPVSENILRGSDGSFHVRWGTRLFIDFRNGQEATYTDKTGTIEAAVGKFWVTVKWVGHPFISGDHVTISGAVALGDIPAEDLNGWHGVRKIDADSFTFPVRHVVGAAVASIPLTGMTFKHDTHLLSGNLRHMAYFNRYLLAFDNHGEIAKVDGEGVGTRIWDYSRAAEKAADVALERDIVTVTSTTFKSTLISCNGYDKDKPLQVDSGLDVEFLVDKATFSNAAVPKADYVIGMHQYLIFGRTQYGDTLVEFSAQQTDGTFTREVDPSDAVEVDLSMVTETVEPVIFGMSVLRDKLYVGMYDRGMLGSVGQYAGDLHEPDFNDTIAEHGVISNRTIVPLGNDIFMCDHSGVPSVGISAASGIFVPTRLSELIAPEIQRHLASLSEDTLRRDAFAVFNKNDNMYMLFLPKYDETLRDLPENPFYFNEKLKSLNYAYVTKTDHNLFEGSYIDVSGADGIGSLTAGAINGRRRVVSVVDDDAFILELGGAPIAQANINGGGSTVKYTPVNDESICYGFEYNRSLKIKRWTRLRGLQFSTGCQSQRGQMFFGHEGKIYKYGSAHDPIHADYVGDTDVAADGLGVPIEWTCDTPWSDLSARTTNKAIKFVRHDTEGTGKFNFSIFADNIMRDPETNELIPVAQMEFTAGDTGGFGAANSATWGSGRRTRENMLWPMLVRGSLFRLRWHGKTREMVRVISTSLLYKAGSVR